MNVDRAFQPEFCPRRTDCLEFAVAGRGGWGRLVSREDAKEYANGRGDGDDVLSGSTFHFLELETAHSMPPESAGSRSPGWRCRGVDVASTGSAQPFFACGALIRSDCLSCAVLHSRVVAQRLCGKGRSQSQSTALACLGYRLNSDWQTGMARPDFSAAATERRALRGTGGGVTPPLAAAASKAASGRLIHL